MNATTAVQFLNVLEIVGESMGLRQNDQYKHLKLLQDVDAIVDDCSDLIADGGMRTAVQRSVADAGYGAIAAVAGPNRWRRAPEPARLGGPCSRGWS